MQVYSVDEHNSHENSNEIKSFYGGIHEQMRYQESAMRSDAWGGIKSERVEGDSPGFLYKVHNSTNTGHPTPQFPSSLAVSEREQSEQGGVS